MLLVIVLNFFVSRGFIAFVWYYSDLQFLLSHRLDQWKSSGEDPFILGEISNGLMDSVPGILYFDSPGQPVKFLFN